MPFFFKIKIEAHQFVSNLIEHTVKEAIIITVNILNKIGFCILEDFKMENGYPWYDSGWLKLYVQAKKIISEHYPAQLEEFIKMTDVLKTRPDFEAKNQDALFSDKVLQECRELIKELTTNELEKQELLLMGRLVVHDHPYFTQLQSTFTDMVSEIAQEPVEPFYNFLSLYNNLGNLGVHLDAPYAKWTLDVCIDQSDIWPIYFSQVQSWPEDFNYAGDDWEMYIKEDERNHFSKYNLEVGDGIVFAGSAQWHYRNRIIQHRKNNRESSHCHLIFFHFIPKGTREIINPSKWAKLLDIPELSCLDTGASGKPLLGQGLARL